MMTLLLAATMTVSPAALKAPGVRYFPSDYYDTVIHDQLQERVLQSWPGPTELVNIWQRGELQLAQRFALLLGASAYHDRQLLPVYRDALQSDRPRLRQAAAYGYRRLIGDAAPDVNDGVPKESAAALVGELDAVAWTLRQHTMVEMWLAVLLMQGERPPPDWHGVVFRRSPSVAVAALDTLADPHDLPSLVWAYENTPSVSVKLSLIQIIESRALQTFIIMPTGNRAGWGRKQHEEAVERMQAWLEGFCDRDVERALIRSFEALGLKGVAPFDAEGCGAWLRVLDRGLSHWWSTAARQLYRCGGPAIQLSVLQKDSDGNNAKRERILSELGLGPPRR